MQIAPILGTISYISFFHEYSDKIQAPFGHTNHVFYIDPLVILHTFSCLCALCLSFVVVDFMTGKRPGIIWRSLSFYLFLLYQGLLNICVVLQFLFLSKLYIKTHPSGLKRWSQWLDDLQHVWFYWIRLLLGIKIIDLQVFFVICM